MYDPQTEPDEPDDELLIEAAIKATHAGIDDAVRAHLVAQQIPGISTGWVLLVAFADIDEDGDDIDGLFDTHSDGLTKWAKVGLLTVALDQQRLDGGF